MSGFRRSRFFILVVGASDPILAPSLIDPIATSTLKRNTNIGMLRGAASHCGCICASCPAAPGSNLGSQNLM